MLSLRRANLPLLRDEPPAARVRAARTEHAGTVESVQADEPASPPRQGAAVSARVVNVLAVMADDAEHAANGRAIVAGVTEDDLAEACERSFQARDAVRELIEAAHGQSIRQIGHSHNKCANMLPPHKGPNLCDKCTEWARFSAALARLGGAQ